MLASTPPQAALVSVVQQVDTVAGNAVHRGVYAAVESAHAAVETEEETRSYAKKQSKPCPRLRTSII